jgi:hypothetical protein
LNIYQKINQFSKVKLKKKKKLIFKVFDDYYFDQKTTSPKNVLIFSPHPDDDVICMGGK